MGIKALKQSTDAYFLENGVYPTTFEELDIDIPYVYAGGTVTDPYIRTSSGITYRLDTGDGYIGANVGGVTLSSWYKNSSWPGTFQCRAKTDNPQTNQTCRSLGGVFLKVQPDTSNNIYVIN